MNIDDLKKLISYEPETGVLRWKHRGAWVVEAGMQSEAQRVRFNKKYAGMPCLCSLDKNGYLTGQIFGRPYKSHRVAYALFYGAWPVLTIDHINRDRADNRAVNLRDVTRRTQQENRRIQSNNSSGIAGVHFNKLSQKWVARKTVGGTRYWVGSFATKVEAIVAKRNFLR